MENGDSQFDPDAKINAPFPFYLDAFMHECGEWKPAERWYYFALLCYLWRHGGVKNTDRDIAAAMGLARRNDWRRFTKQAQNRLKLHPRIAGFVTHARIDRDRLKRLKANVSNKNRQQAYRNRNQASRVTNSGVTRPYTQESYIYKGMDEPELFDTDKSVDPKAFDQVGKTVGRSMKAPGAQQAMDASIRRNLVNAVGEGTVQAAEGGKQWAIDKCEQASRKLRLGWYAEKYAGKDSGND